MGRDRFVRLILAATVLVGSSVPARAAEPTQEQRAAVPLLDGVPRQIVPGVYSLGELTPVFAYLVESGDGLVLIDTGYSGQLDRLARAIVSLGFDPNDIRHILVTHLHLDHWMNMDWIRSMTGARTYMGRPDAEVIERRPPSELVIPARPAAPGLVIPPAHVDYPIDGRQHLPIPGIDMQAVPCAGHTPGSTCYLLETGPWRILFGGDAIMSVRSGLGTYTTKLHPRFGGDVEAYRETLTRLATIPVNVVLPGHPYVDRERTGNHPHPVVGATGWQSIIRAGLGELDRTARRYREDGYDFLDEEPKQIVPGLFSLGTLEGEAVYALTDGRRTCLVDPWRMSPDALTARLIALGLDPSAVETILLTEPRSLRSFHPPRINAATRLRIFGPTAPVDSSLASSALELHPIRDRVAISACGLEIVAQPTVTWRSGFVTYLLPVGERLAAFTGDAVAPLSADDEIVAPAAALTTQWNPPETDTLVAMADLAVAIWLPSRPFAAQNANLYDDRWRRTIRINLLALEHARSFAR